MSGRSSHAAARRASRHICSGVTCGPGSREISSISNSATSWRRNLGEDVARSKRRHGGARRRVEPHRDRAAGEEEADHGVLVLVLVLVLRLVRPHGASAFRPEHLALNAVAAGSFLLLQHVEILQCAAGVEDDDRVIA